MSPELATAPTPSPSAWRRYTNQLIAAHLSPLTRYLDRVIQVHPRAEDTGLLLSQLDTPETSVVPADEPFPCLTDTADQPTGILLNGNLNYSHDILSQLEQIKPNLARSSRVLVVAYNSYLSGIYKLAGRLGLRKGPLPTTFLTRHDLANLCKLSGFDVVHSETAGYFPWRLMGLGNVINRLLSLIPVVRWLGLANVVVLRPIIAEGDHFPSLSIVIPARNERGNILPALERLPDLGCDMEIIFVEGHSQDGTWEEIEKQAAQWQGPQKIVTLQQPGKGKVDAVRVGFAAASCDLLTILDADLTMPPELLGQFYEAYRQGHGDFVNGSRLVYPMEGEAMRFLNHLGNVFFAKALSWVLGTPLSDSLCGTKFFSRADYARMTRWRDDFGDFDPFGDFEMLFPGAELGMGVVDIPIRYRARQYGSTQISRFRHGVVLLRMTAVGFWRIKLGVGRGPAG